MRPLFDMRREIEAHGDAAAVLTHGWCRLRGLNPDLRFTKPWLNRNYILLFNMMAIDIVEGVTRRVKQDAIVAAIGVVLI